MFSRIKKSMLIIFFCLALLSLEISSELCRDPQQYFQFVEGFETKVQRTTTEDGYNLVMFQSLPNKGRHSLEKGSQTSKREVVLVIHGISSSADTFALASDSIIKYLLKEGYEVWAANSRGTKYSCTHEYLTNDSKEYWDFSFQEMAEFDVPAFYQKVMEVSGAEEITVIAHSQGATQTFAALSSSKSLQAKTTRFIALAPVLFMNRFMDHPNLFTYLAKMKLTKLADFLGIYALDHVNAAQNKLVYNLIDLFCVKTTFVCKLFLSLTTEKQPDSVDLEQMPFFLSFNPSGASIKSFKHFMQLMYTKTPRFQKFDYGEQGNLEKYGSESPPVYDISQIQTKVALFYGQGDNLCTLENIGFINNLKKDCVNFYMDLWGHVDYTWGKDKSTFFGYLSQALTL